MTEKKRGGARRPSSPESSDSSDSSDNSPKKRISVSVERAAKLTSLGRTTLYKDIQSKVLRSGTRGRRRVIRVKDLEKYVDDIIEGRLQDDAEIK